MSRIPPARFPVRGNLRIRTRLLAALLGLALVLVAVPTLILEAQARRSLDAELATRLQAVAAAASQMIDPSLLAPVLSLGPEGGSRTRARLGERLTALKDATGVRRIYLLDLDGRDQLDTDPRAVPGAEMPQALAHRGMLAEVAHGRAASSPLFRDPRGGIRKTGYAPLMVRDEVIGFVGVEADARFLHELGAMRRRILIIALLGFGVAGILSFGLARGLTRPLGDLVEAARSMGGGDLDRPIPIGRADEVGFLARTLEEARGRLAERDRTLRAMVAGIAHEVRNPLGGIQIYAELLESDASLSAAQRDRIRKILKEIHRLGEIVEEFLTYARPHVPERSVFDPVGIVNEAVDLLAGFLADREVETIVSLPREPAPVLADPGQLRQVLLNLVRNAAEASPAGGKIRIGWVAHGPTVAITVEDEGPGIPDDQKDRVFEPFYTTRPDGAGLGLPIVRHLVEQNGGRVSLERAERGGCRFTVRLAGARDGGKVG